LGASVTDRRMSMSRVPLRISVLGVAIVHPVV
jgi:hypothetical protein